MKLSKWRQLIDNIQKCTVLAFYVQSMSTSRGGGVGEGVTHINIRIDTRKCILKVSPNPG